MDYHDKTSVENILLTGATGVLGARILCELLRSTDSYIYCLSRAKSHKDALAAIEKVLFVYDSARELVGETWRIIPMLGDVIKPRFGLEQRDYDDLANSIELVFHCAANVSLIASYEKLHPTNVEGTQRVVDFCLTNNAPLLYVSSFSVIGNQLYHEAVLMEDDLDIGQGFEEFNYERSKFEAEKLIRQAGIDQGLNWATVRPGNIWGDSETGEYPLFETKVKGIYYEMIKALVETGYSFSSNEDFDISPVDYVAKASLYIAFNIHQTNRNTYNLTNPSPGTYNDIVAHLKKYNFTIRIIDNEEYFEALYEERIKRDGKPYRSLFTDLMSMMASEGLEELAKYDTSQAQALLEPVGIKCPASDFKLMKTYLNYSVKHDWINGPDRQTPLAEINEEIERKVFMQHLYDEDLDMAGVV